MKKLKLIYCFAILFLIAACGNREIQPTIKIQEEVVNTIFSIKNKAKRLKEEGNALLEEVKQKIEKLILK